MSSRFIEPLEHRSLLSAVLTLTDADQSVLDDHTAHQATPSGYVYPPPSGGGGGGGGSAAAAKNKAKAFTARMSGAGEVPRRVTRARGQAHFQLVNNGKALKFQLQVSKISNVVAAHLHLGTATENGPIVAFLYGPQTPGGGKISGQIASGRLTAASLQGPLAGLSFNRLVAEMRAGRIYVNVHTDNGAGDIDTGPGDFASGEIRGQVGVATKRK